MTKTITKIIAFILQPIEWLACLVAALAPTLAVCGMLFIKDATSLVSCIVGVVFLLVEITLEGGSPREQGSIQISIAVGAILLLLTIIVTMIFAVLV